MQPFEVVGSITRADLTRALLAFPEVNRKRWIVFGCNLLLWVGLWVGSSGASGVRILAVTFVVLVGLISIGQPWTLPLRARRALGLDQPATWRFDRAGVRLTGPLGSTEVGWARVAELAPGAMLTSKPRIVFALPPLTADQVAAVDAWRAAPAEPTPAPADAVPLHAVPPGGGPAGRIVATGLPTPTQTAAFVRLATRPDGRRIAIASVLVAVVATVAFLGSLPRPWTGDRIALAVVVAALCALVLGAALAAGGFIGRALAPLTGRLDQRRVWGDATPAWWFESDRLGVSAATATEISWSRVSEVSVRAELLVLRLTPKGVVATPLDAFAPGDAARVVALARAAGARIHPSAEPAATTQPTPSNSP